ncbi:MAG: hypothetical protein IJ113_01065 [Eggerthellaceae bacterium]|nr:hypothetical protein [Eggerthellaceae bacterium]
MRTISIKPKEYMEFKLGEGETVYRLPLAHCLPLATTARFSEVNAIKDVDEKAAAALRIEYDMMREYMPDIADTLTAEQVGEIFAAWNDESTAAGANLGE